MPPRAPRPRRSSVSPALDAASRELLRLIVDATPECIKVTDANGILLMMNRAGLDMIEAESQEQVLGRSVLELIAPEDRDAFERLTRRAFEGEEGRLQMRICGLRGSSRMVAARALPLRDARGAVVSVLGVTRDLTQERRAQQALKVSEHFFSGVFEQAPVGVVLSRPDGTMLRVNRAFCAMLGYSEQELLGRTAFSLTHPDDVPGSREARAKLIEGGTDRYDLEKRYLAKNGKVVWARLTAVRLQGLDEPRLLGIVEDITERRRTEQALREAEARYRAFVEQVPAITYMVALDGSGRTVYLSPQVENVTGYAAAEFLADPLLWRERLHPDDRDSAFEAWNEAARKFAPFDRQYRVIRRDGAVVWLHDHGIAVAGEDGKPPVYYGVLLDINDRKRSEEALHVREGQLLDAQRLADMGSWEWDVGADTATGSDALLRILGVAPTAHANFGGFLRIVHPDDRARVQATVTRALSDGRPFDLEHRILRPGGEERILRARGEANTDEAGRVVRLFGIHQDVTERTRAEERITRNLARLQALYAISAAVNDGLEPSHLHGPALEALAQGAGADRAAVLLFDAGGVMRFVAWRGLSDGYRAAVEGHSPWTAATLDPAPILVPDVARDTSLAPFATRMLAEGIRALAFIPIYRGRLLGKFMLYYNAPRAIASEEVEFALSVSRHIAIAAERAHAERALRQSHEQLRRLAAGIEQAREEERTRIAREIHDELGQALTALKMDLAWLEGRLKRGRSPLAAKARESAQLAEETIRSVRRISTALRPAVLDDLGIVAAIEWLVRDFGSHAGIRCGLESEFEELALDGEAATQVFRFCQEALTNVARHSGATEAAVVIARDGARLRVEVQDNGSGLSEERALDPHSLGIVGMRERARLLGGEMEILGSPARGTSVTLRFPFA